MDDSSSNYEVQIDSPALAKIGGFFLKYFIRFIEAPFLVVLMLNGLGAYTTFFYSSATLNRILAIMLLIPSVGLRKAFDPNTVFEGGATEIIIIAAFWLFIYHLFWEIGYWITKKAFFRNGHVRTKILAWILSILGLLFVIGFAVTHNHTVGDTALLFIFIALATLVGLGSLYLSGWLRFLANMMTMPGRDPNHA